MRSGVTWVARHTDIATCEKRITGRSFLLCEKADKGLRCAPSLQHLDPTPIASLRRTWLPVVSQPATPKQVNT